MACALGSFSLLVFNWLQLVLRNGTSGASPARSLPDIIEQAAISNIHWAVGLIGLSKSHLVISGALIWFETFGSYFIATLTVPLLVIWPLSFKVVQCSDCFLNGDLRQSLMLHLTCCQTLETSGWRHKMGFLGKLVYFHETQ